MQKFLVNAAIGALMSGALAIPAHALDAKIGGSDRGGISARAGAGDTSVGARVGGRDGNVARARVGAGDNDATVNIGRGSGPLVSGTSNGNPVNGGSDTDADVNLGALGGLAGSIPPGGMPGGVPGGPGGGSVGDVPDSVRDAFSSMSSGQQAELKTTCQSVLNSKQRYDASMIQLCQMLQLL